MRSARAIRGTATPHDMDERSESLMETTGDESRRDDGPSEYVYKRQIVWFNAIGFLVLHLGALYGLYLFLTSSMVLTMLWSEFFCKSMMRGGEHFLIRSYHIIFLLFNNIKITVCSHLVLLIFVRIVFYVSKSLYIYIKKKKYS